MLIARRISALNVWTHMGQLLVRSFAFGPIDLFICSWWSKGAILQQNCCVDTQSYCLQTDNLLEPASSIFPTARALLSPSIRRHAFKTTHPLQIQLHFEKFDRLHHFQFPFPTVRPSVVRRVLPLRALRNMLSGLERYQ